MRDLNLKDTGGHDSIGAKIADGELLVYGELLDGEITVEVGRRFDRNGQSSHSQAYLSIDQAKALRKYLKRLIARASE